MQLANENEQLSKQSATTNAYIWNRNTANDWHSTSLIVESNFQIRFDKLSMRSFKIRADWFVEATKFDLALLAFRYIKSGICCQNFVTRLELWILETLTLTSSVAIDILPNNLRIRCPAFGHNFLAFLTKCGRLNVNFSTWKTPREREREKRKANWKKSIRLAHPRST